MKPLDKRKLFASDDGQHSMNADQRLIRDYAKGGIESSTITSSPIAVALKAEIIALGKHDGRVTISFEPGSTFTQANGVLQGGAIASMLDMAMAFAALHRCLDGQLIATVNLNVSYLRAAPVGRFIVAGEVERIGRSLIFAKAVMHGASQTAVATASSTLSILRTN